MLARCSLFGPLFLPCSQRRSVLSGTGSEISGTLSSSGWLYLDVTDSGGRTDGDDLYITVSPSAPDCPL